MLFIIQWNIVLTECNIYKKETYAEIAAALDKYMNSTDEPEVKDEAAQTAKEEPVNTPKSSEPTDFDAELDALFKK